MNGVAVKPLTVGFHEIQFLSKLNQENQLGFWFQLSDEQREQAGSPWGPSNPQTLNRYSYVLNNPLKYTDPSGHLPSCNSVLQCFSDVLRAVTTFLSIYNNIEDIVSNVALSMVVDVFSRSAGQLDPTDAGGKLTRAGRALAKHNPGSRPGSAFPQVRGSPAEINRMAQEIVDDILTNPGSNFIARKHPRFGDIVDVIAPDGRGLRFRADTGDLIGFLEP